MPLIKRERSFSASSSHSPTSSTARFQEPRRVVLACIECRNRKCKCDGGFPTCSSCIKYNRVCERKPVTAEENQEARRRKNYPEVSRATPTRSLKAKHSPRAAIPLRVSSPRDSEDDLEEDALGEDDEDYIEPSQQKQRKSSLTTYKRQRVASFVSAQAHSPAPLAPPSPVASQALPVQSPQELAPQFQQHALQYFTCPPFHPLAISLPPFQHVPAAAYPTPFLTSTEYCATSHAPQPNYFPFHHPTVHQQQQQQQYEVIAFQPPPSSPPAAYHLPLPMPMAHPQTYSAPYNYPAASIYPTEPAQYAHPLPTPFSPPTFADPFSTTTATGAGFPFPMHVEPLAPLPYLPLPPLPHNTYAELPALTPTTATPDQLPTPRSDPCSPTLATAPLPFEMERQWSRGSAGGRLGTPFEGSFLFGGGGDGERSWGR